MQHPSTIALILLGLVVFIGAQFGNEKVVSGGQPQTLTSEAVTEEPPASKLLLPMNAEEPPGTEALAEGLSLDRSGAH